MDKYILNFSINAGYHGIKRVDAVLNQKCPYTSQQLCGDWCPMFEVFPNSVKLHCCGRMIDIEKG